MASRPPRLLFFAIISILGGCLPSEAYPTCDRVHQNDRAQLLDGFRVGDGPHEVACRLLKLGYGERTIVTLAASNRSAETSRLSDQPYGAIAAKFWRWVAALKTGDSFQSREAKNYVMDGAPLSDFESWAPDNLWVASTRTSFFVENYVWQNVAFGASFSFDHPNADCLLERVKFGGPIVAHTWPSDPRIEGDSNCLRSISLSMDRGRPQTRVRDREIRAAAAKIFSTFVNDNPGAIIERKADDTDARLTLRLNDSRYIVRYREIDHHTTLEIDIQARKD